MDNNYRHHHPHSRRPNNLLFTALIIVTPRNVNFFQQCMLPKSTNFIVVVYG